METRLSARRFERKLGLVSVEFTSPPPPPPFFFLDVYIYIYILSEFSVLFYSGRFGGIKLHGIPLEFKTFFSFFFFFLPLPIPTNVTSLFGSACKMMRVYGIFFLNYFFFRCIFR